MRQARTLLRAGFTALPIIAGLDKITFDVDIALRDLGLAIGAVALGLLCSRSARHAT